MKKIAVFVVVGQILAMALALSIAGAQTVNTNIIVSPPMPITPPSSTSDSGFMQFNNLVVENVSGTIPTAEIIATNPSSVIVPMRYNGASGSGTGASAGSVTAAPSAASSVTCYRFDTENSSAGNAITCPAPSTSASATSSAATAPAATAMPMIPASATPGTSGVTPMIYPSYPIPTQAYRIEVDASTKLYLRDRTTAVLSDFASGDQINVFGYYNADGSIQAYLVRDLSKPAQSELLQLNNVDLVSISASTTPATLVVAQQAVYPCYGFDATGNTKQSIACPMGVQSSVSSSALQNVQVPSALMPIWDVARKYVVNIDDQTVLLDSNRTKLQISDLQIGDELNVYGETNDNGQTLNADIVRDLSIPATAQTYSGTVTQVNSDGSFVIQTTDGRTITVKSPIQVGATLQLTGILDRLQNVLSQVTSIINSNGAIPLSSKAQGPGPLHTQGSGPLPPTASGTPNATN